MIPPDLVLLVVAVVKIALVVGVVIFVVKWTRRDGPASARSATRSAAIGAVIVTATSAVVVTALIVLSPHRSYPAKNTPLSPPPQVSIPCDAGGCHPPPGFVAPQPR